MYQVLFIVLVYIRASCVYVYPSRVHQAMRYGGIYIPGTRYILRGKYILLWYCCTYGVEADIGWLYIYMWCLVRDKIVFRPFTRRHK